MLDTVQITRATVADAPAIWALQQAAYQQEALLYEDYTIAPLMETPEALAGHFARLTFLKAVCADALVGSVRAVEAEKAAAPAATALVPAAAVSSPAVSKVTALAPAKK